MNQGRGCRKSIVARNALRDTAQGPKIHLWQGWDFCGRRARRRRKCPAKRIRASVALWLGHRGGVTRAAGSMTHLNGAPLACGKRNQSDDEDFANSHFIASDNAATAA